MTPMLKPIIYACFDIACARTAEQEGVLTLTIGSCKASTVGMTYLHQDVLSEHTTSTEACYRCWRRPTLAGSTRIDRRACDMMTRQMEYE
jgi:hypothetical protein